MADRRGPLALLAVAMLLTFVLAPLMFVAWALALGALLWLARDPRDRRAALYAAALLCALVVVALPLSGLSVGWRGRTIGGFDGAGADEGMFASLAAVGAPAATALYLALATGAPRARRLARAATVTLALALLVLVVVRATGEKIQGIAGLLGAATLVLVLAAMGSALWEETRRTSGSAPA